MTMRSSLFIVGCLLGLSLMNAQGRLMDRDKGPGHASGEDDKTKCENMEARIASGGNIPTYCFLDAKSFNLTTDEATDLLKNLVDPRAIEKIIAQAVGSGGNVRAKADEIIKKLQHQIRELSNLKVKAAVGSIIKVLGGAKALKVDDISQLGRDLVKTIPPEYIKKLKEASFDKLLEILFDGERNRSEEILPTPEGRAICERAFKRIRNVDTVTKLNQVSQLLPCAPVRVCKDIPADLVNTELSAIADLPWDCKPKSDRRDSDGKKKLKEKFPQMVECAKSIVRKLENATAVLNSLENLKNCLSKGDLQSLVSKQSCPALTDLAEDIKLSDFPQVTKKLKNKCAKKAKEDPSNVTISDVGDMGSIATELPKNQLEGLNKTVLCSPVFRKLLKKNKNAPRETHKIVAERCLKDKVLTADSILDEGGDTILSVGLRKLYQFINRNALINKKDAKDELKRSAEKTKGPKGKALRKLVSDKLSIMDQVTSKRTMKEVSLARLKEEVTDVIKDLGLDDDSVEPDLPHKISKWAIKKYLTNNVPEDLTVDDLKALKSVVRGFLTDDIERLSKNETFSNAVVLCQHTNWPGKSVRAVLQKQIIPALKEVNDTDYMQTLSVTDVSVLGCECLMHFRPNELERASPDVCKAICTKIGSCARLRCLNPKLRTKLMETCLKCSRGNGDTVSEDDLATLGSSLATELTDVEINQLDIAALRNSIPHFRRGCMLKKARAQLFAKLKDVFGAANAVDESEASEAGDLLTVYAEGGTLGDISDAVLAEAAPQILEDLYPEDEEAQQRQQCCLDGMNEEERQSWKEVRDAVIKAIKDAIDGRASAGDAGSRRKRAAASWTCDDLIGMGPSITTVTKGEIQAIDSTEFANCVQTFGQYSDWTVEKRDALLVKVTQDVDLVCELTSSDIEDLGYIDLSITTGDISCLALTEDDAVAALGGLSGWTDAQRTALAARFRALRADITMPNLDSTHLSVLGHILCGLPAADLTGITSIAFNGASAQIGELTTCPVEHLKSLKSVAARTDTFGAVSTWTADVYSELGAIIGGLTPDELKAVSESALEGFQSHGLKLIPAGTLKAMTVDQLESLSSEQAQALAVEQKRELSIAQQNALQKAQFGEYANIIADTSTSLPGAGSRLTGVLTVLILSLLTTLLCV